jgi:hypothetical protein
MRTPYVPLHVIMPRLPALAHTRVRTCLTFCPSCLLCAARRKKMVADDHDSDSDHGDFDPNALREHEEFTKACACQRV